MDTVSAKIENLTGMPVHIQYLILLSMIAIVVVWICRILILRIVWTKTSDPKLRYHWRKIIAYIHWTLTGLALLRIWFEFAKSMDSLLNFSAAGLAAGLAIALQDLVKSIAGWIFLVSRKPFKLGDRIEIGKLKGDVIDIRPFKFSMVEIGNWVDADQSTGRVVHVPNSLIFSETILNYGEGFQFIWNEIPVLLTFESDWKKAKELLTGIAYRYADETTKHAAKKIEEASRKYLIFYKNLTPIVYTSIRDSGVLLTIRYLVEPRRRRGSEMSIMEDILEAFGKETNIDFAYPTQRFYDNTTEGKKVVGIPAGEEA